MGLTGDTDDSYGPSLMFGDPATPYHPNLADKQIADAKNAYVNGWIDVEEFEMRVGAAFGLNNLELVVGANFISQDINHWEGFQEDGFHSEQNYEDTKVFW